MKLIEGVDYYIDPETGRLVWTERRLLLRGYCCHSRCRHCPWGCGPEDALNTSKKESYNDDSGRRD